MSTVHVCDVCKSEGKLVESTQYFSVKGRPELKLDYCSACGTKHAIAAMSIREYIKFVYKITLGIMVPEERLAELLKR